MIALDIRNALLIGIAILALNAGAQAQEPWDPYEPRSMSSIMIAERDHMLRVFADEPYLSIALTGNSFPSLPSILFMDSVRSTSAARRALIDRWVESYAIDTRSIGTFETELLFREGTLDIWLPVQSSLLPYFEDEVARGDEVTLFIVWAGARKPRAGALDWVFLAYGVLKE